MNPLLAMNDISKTFPGVRALDDVSFDVGTGEIFGFLGPNGAGKTTVMRMLTAFLPPTTGRDPLQRLC